MREREESFEFRFSLLFLPTLAMLRSIRPLIARQLVRVQSTTASRSASVLPSASTSSSAFSPPPSPTSATSSSQLKPQPFIPRPQSRTLQLESLSTTPHDPLRSTTLRFLDPTSSTPRSLSIPNLWLRDSSIHPSHVHPSSNQKLFRTTDVPLEGKLIGYGVHEIPDFGECLVTEWSTPLKTKGMDLKSVKLSVVPLELLKGMLMGEREQDKVMGNLPESREWDKVRLEKTLVKVDYRQYMEDSDKLFEVLDGLVKDGIVFLTNVPTDKKEGHETELKRLVERIGSLRKTWYGDLWDVKAEEGSRNIAYTNLDLGLHMDLTYDSYSFPLLLHSTEHLTLNVVTLITHHDTNSSTLFKTIKSLADLPISSIPTPSPLTSTLQTLHTSKRSVPNPSISNTATLLTGPDSLALLSN